MAYTESQWEKAKVLFGLGKSPQEIADELGFKSRDTVSKRATKENWVKNKILQEKTELMDLEKKNSTIQQENSTMVEKLAKLEDFEITILQEVVESELKRKSILFSTANLSLIRKNQMLTKNTKQVVDFETIYDDNGKPLSKKPVTLNIELSPSDYKAIDEGIDKNAITLEIGQRHSSQVINNTNATQNNTTLTAEEISIAIANGLPD